MTDRAGRAARAGAQPRRRSARRLLARFAQMFADEPLVMDKWFTMQATMHRHAGRSAGARTGAHAARPSGVLDRAIRTACARWSAASATAISPSSTPPTAPATRSGASRCCATRRAQSAGRGAASRAHSTAGASSRPSARRRCAPRSRRVAATPGAVRRRRARSSARRCGERGTPNDIQEKHHVAESVSPSTWSRSSARRA